MNHGHECVRLFEVGVQGLVDRVDRDIDRQPQCGAQCGPGRCHQQRRRHSLATDIAQRQPHGIAGADPVEEIPPDLPGWQAGGGELKAGELGHGAGQEAGLYLSRPRQFLPQVREKPVALGHQQVPLGDVTCNRRGAHDHTAGIPDRRER